MKYRLPLLASACAVALTLSFGAAKAEVSPLDLVQPIADYKVYVQENLDVLVKDTKAFTDAVKAGDLERLRRFIPPPVSPTKRSNRLPNSSLISTLRSTVVRMTMKMVRSRKTSPDSTVSNTACSRRIRPKISRPLQTSSMLMCWNFRSG